MNKLSFQIISDIHFESLDKKISTRDMIDSITDILIINGDVGRIENFDKYKEIIMSFCNDFKKVYLIPGNHEYYSEVIPIETLETYLKRLESDIHNLKILDDEYVDLPNNFRIYGTTLWSRLTTKDAANKRLHMKSNDDICIGNKFWMNKMFFSCLHNLNTIIHKSKRDGKTLIVASHYAPRYEECLDKKFYTCPYRFWYATNLGFLMNKYNVHTWIYGHTHVNNDIILYNGTRLVSNQYKGNGYIRDKIIEVE